MNTDLAEFSVDIQTSDADALLCEWAPSEELLTFHGVSAWYCCEPTFQFDRMEGGRWLRFREGFADNDFLFHNHSSPESRVPHITHFTELRMNVNDVRLPRAIAVVSNFGGGPRQRPSGIEYRNFFATHGMVDLFGRRGWKSYRATRWSIPRRPRNYMGELAGDWPASHKRDLLSTYKVAICLENACEPNYFTEKFVEAVIAGCIPVYRAHPTVRDQVLKGACWIDPADYSDDPKCTIQAALDMNLTEVQEINRSWLNSEKLQASHHLKVFERIGQILSYRMSQR